MELIASSLALLLAASCGLNVFLFYKSKQPKVERRESAELQEFLGDLLTGTGLVTVSRVAPADVFIRSPRGRL